MPAHATLRASVTADADGLSEGDATPVLVDGSDTPITANGLAGYKPTPGDRLLVQRVGGQVEVLQFISRGSVPYRTDSSKVTFSTDDATGTPEDGDVWFKHDGSDGIVKQWVGLGGVWTHVGELQGFTFSSGDTGLRIVLTPDNGDGVASIQFYSDATLLGELLASIVGGVGYIALASKENSAGFEVANDHTVAEPVIITSGTITGDIGIYGQNVNVHGNLVADDDVQAGNGGALITLNPPTTTSAANAFIGSLGHINKVTSLSEAKLEQRPFLTHEAKRLLALTPKTWFDKAEVEANEGQTDGLRRIPGVVAEDVAIHAPEFATFDKDGALEGVAYDRIGVALIPLIRDLYARIAVLEARLDSHDVN